MCTRIVHIVVLVFTVVLLHATWAIHTIYQNEYSDLISFTTDEEGGGKCGNLSHVVAIESESVFINGSFA